MVEKRKIDCFNCPLCEYKKLYYEDEGEDKIDRIVESHVLGDHPSLYDLIDWKGMKEVSIGF